MKSSRQVVWIAAGLALTLVLWSVLRPWLPHSELAENNFQANLVRLQAWKLDPHPSAVLVGSSLTARLLPRYFDGTALESVANLGLNGSGAETGLRILLESSNLPSRVLVEGHRLSKRWSTNDDLLIQSGASPSMALARWIPALRADVRPSSMLYSLIKNHLRVHSVSPDQAAPIGGAESPEPGWEKRMQHLLNQVRDRGVRVMLYRLPAGIENLPTPEAPNLIAELARDWGLEYLGVDRECELRGIHLEYTDGRHLSPDSAAAVARVLAELCGTSGPH